MAPVPQPELSEEERAAVARAVAEFNAGLYFECHDTLEEVWSGVRGPARDFFQALIQVAVGHYHLNGGNGGGARRMFERSLARLERYPERYFGFDAEGQRVELRAWIRRLEDESEGIGSAPEGVPHPPVWRIDGLPPASALPAV
jgi:predicted metal-dependent hydrolase